MGQIDEPNLMRPMISLPGLNHNSAQIDRMTPMTQKPRALSSNEFSNGTSADTPKLEIQNSGNVLTIHWNDGRNDGTHSRYHAIWLRDNGQDPDTRDPGNGQKLITLQNIPADTAIRSATLNPQSQIEFVFSPDNKHTHIDLNWLKANRYDDVGDPTLLSENIITWGRELAGDLPRTTFQQATEDPKCLIQWLEHIDRRGFAVMSGLPSQSHVNHYPILEAIKLLGYVRETNYGQVFEVRTETNPVNLAYTGQGLQVHTDNPYRDPVPTLQILGCLQNEADGGDSIVVDSFRAVEILRKESPDYFELLSTFHARFDYQQSNDIHLHTSKPMIACTPQGQVTGIRFNNRSCHTLRDIPFAKMEDYYRAYRRFGQILEDPQLAVTFKLNPNELFVVDNTRVLHGRTAYSSTGTRWLHGAYADKDSLKSRLSVLRQQYSDSGITAHPNNA